jgi:CRP/FNR family nitrogen fixation transcriptional regulator
MPRALSGASPAGALAPLDHYGITICASRNEEIFVEGDPAKYGYRLVSGCVRTVKLLEDGRRQVGEFLLPGDLFALESLATHDFSAEAVVDSKLRRYSRAALEEFADHDPGFARQLRELVGDRLRTARGRMVTLGRKTAAERLAGFLLEMADRLNADASGVLELPMNRTDMADHLGLTIETVCRGLTELRRHGTIAIDRARISIRDRPALGAPGRDLLH